MQKTTKIAIALFLCIALHGCGQKVEPTSSTEPIASANGLDLTEAHFETYLRYVEEYAGETADIKTQLAIKSQLKQTFLKEPEKLLEQLAGLKSGESTPVADTQNGIAPVPTPVQNTQTTDLAEGHKMLRQKLAGDIGQMQFDVAAANTFRQFVANILLTSTTGNYNTGITGSDSSNTNSQTQFCANGTYIESLSGHLSIQVEGAGAVSSGTTYITGYWDVATLPNGMMIIVMYSTHPYVLEDWPNGIIPFVVAKYGEDFMALPSGDLYRRAANQYCN